MVKIGYARVSTKDQNLDLQIKALKDAGCDKIYTEKISGRKTYRPIWGKLMRRLQSGDVLIVWKIDRIARSARNMCEIADAMRDKNVIIISVSDGINTSTIIGEMFFKLAGVFAEMEISNLRERTIEGLKLARINGKTLGRPPGPSRIGVIDRIKELRSQSLTDNDIMRSLDIPKSTYYRYKRHIKG